MADQATNIFSNGQESQPAATDPVATGTTAPAAATAPEVSQPQSQPLTVPAEVQAMIGEGRKYANVQSALASVAPAQAHIATLENENASLKQRVAELEAQVSHASSVDDILAKIASGQQTQAGQPTNLGMDEAAVLRLLEQQELKRVITRNQEQLTAQLISKFGDSAKATEALKGKATELGLGFDAIVELAGKSPAAVLGFFGQTVTTPNPIPSSTTTTTAPFQQEQPQAMSYVASSGTTSDLVAAFRNCGKAVNNGQEISHAY